jgi:hypothetical protein
MFNKRSKNNVIIRLKGGLGNQLFQFNYGYNLSELYKVVVLYDSKTGFQTDFYKRSVFDSMFCIYGFKKYVGLLSNITILRIFKILNKYLKTNVLGWLYLNEEQKTLKDFGNFLSGNYYIEGYFQDNVVININFLNMLNEKLFNVSLNDIDEGMLIIHFRSNQFDDTLSFDYYEKAVLSFFDKFEINKLIIYSDSKKVEELSNYLKLKCGLNLQIETNCEDIAPEKLLKKFLIARYFIGSNGTFSFWASLLGIGRFVYSPSTNENFNNSQNYYFYN